MSFVAEPKRIAQLPGETRIRIIPSLSRKFGISGLQVKDESENPFGTHKDRKSWRVIREAQSKGISILCILTAGNAGMSLASMAARSGLSVVAIVGQNLPHVAERLESVCTRVVQVDLRKKRWSAKELRAIAGETSDRPILDATNRIHPYQQVGFELAREAPDHVVVPVGGGELFLAVAMALRKAGASTRVWGVAVRNENSIADKLYAPWTPYMNRILRLTGADGPHRLIHLSDDRPIIDAYETTRAHLHCEPSSAAVFAALPQVEAGPEETVVAINTGRFRSDST